MIDTGIGIPEDTLGRLFQRFTQADASTQRKFGGTGLGLALCREFVELMRGEIGVESSPGSGSTFWFTARFGALADDVDAGLDPLDGLRVLLVDHSATHRELLSERLRSWGVEVRTLPPCR